MAQGSTRLIKHLEGTEIYSEQGESRAQTQNTEAKMERTPHSSSSKRPQAEEGKRQAGQACQEERTTASAKIEQKRAKQSQENAPTRQNSVLLIKFMILLIKFTILLIIIYEIRSEIISLRTGHSC